jgi:hypothetical protein
VIQKTILLIDVLEKTEGGRNEPALRKDYCDSQRTCCRSHENLVNPIARSLEARQNESILPHLGRH